MILKLAKKQSFMLFSGSNIFKYIRRVIALIYLNETSISFFAKLAIFYCLNKDELRTNCWENHWAKGMTADICFLVFAHIRHICQNFGTHMW